MSLIDIQQIRKQSH